jgi:protein-S-isoprenylcysteine O-methyltransferase Ste14
VRWLEHLGPHLDQLGPARRRRAALQQGFRIEILPLLALGYLQYYFVGRYRLREGGGGPGISIPPERLVTEGPYRWCRNPMYLGHLIFFAGLALALQSWLAAAVLACHLVWFDWRVRGDEARLAALFREPYRDYVARVKRWIPGIL